MKENRPKWPQAENFLVYNLAGSRTHFKESGKLFILLAKATKINQIGNGYGRAHGCQKNIHFMTALS